ncbi:formimidoylglutamase [Phaeocystidibacter luteus]|uniref:Formimidoylglutamase n=1 Tax=Phaeocystidibacter luteus TaxID=911197 RepID=A0A6N6RJC9_9FLAO|nr:formimidoylglutamase [Phaeocystidibacter luteus]KAB2813681.1 formimidoylglutamase [Phaeocystidibacter luteus]
MLTDILSPVPGHILSAAEDLHPGTLGRKLQIHAEVSGLPDLEQVKIGIIGVQEDRGSHFNRGSADGPDKVRQYLYQLMLGHWGFEIADLGNIYKGETLEDSIAGLRIVVEELRKQDVIPLVIGGSQDLTYAMYRAYDKLEQTVNLVSIDSRFDLGQHQDGFGSHNYLSHIVLNKPYNLFNFSNLGYQSYFIPPEEIDLMERMHFETHRIGKLRADMSEVEPVVRDADMVTFDMSAVRQGDSPAHGMPSPNGFSGEEACAISRYVGLSDKVSCFGIFEFNPALDFQGMSAHLMAQMAWYFIEGVQQRRGDYPFASKKDYTKFTVLIDEGELELIFYKSPLSERWWIEVPIRQAQHMRHALIPCNAKDYEAAMEGEIPDRWWKAQQKGL